MPDWQFCRYLSFELSYQLARHSGVGHGVEMGYSMRSQLVRVRNDDMNVGRERRPDLIWRGEEDDSGSHVAPSRVASRVGGAY